MTILILTATIRVPPSAPGIVRADPLVRLRDYQNTLAFYISFLGKGLDRIIFAENSGSDLSELQEIAMPVTGYVDFLSFQGNDFPPAYGRCFGEATIIDEVMQSQHVSNRPEATIYWKSTGRYQVKNFDRMTKTMPPGAQFYCDMRRRGAQRWADMRLMSWTRKGYREFLAGIAPLLREDLRNYRPGEEALFDVLEQRFSNSTLQYARSFVTEPLIDGFRAFDNKNWSSGRQMLVYHARNLQRQILQRVVF